MPDSPKNGRFRFHTVPLVRATCIAHKWRLFVSSNSCSQVKEDENGACGEFTLILDRDFLADLRYWTETQPRIAVKILSLVEELSRDPFQGT
jgi:hypothetical protein